MTRSGWRSSAARSGRGHASGRRRRRARRGHASRTRSSHRSLHQSSVCEVVGHRRPGRARRARARAGVPCSLSIEVGPTGLSASVGSWPSTSSKSVSERPSDCAGFREPDRVDVRADEVLVGEVELRRRDLAGHHPFGAAEEVLVVAVEAWSRTCRRARAGRSARRGPSAARSSPGSAARCADSRRSARRCRRRAPSSASRTARAAPPCGTRARAPRVPRADLGGVLARFDALRVARIVPVEVDEELVRAPAVGRRARHADLVVDARFRRRRASAAERPGSGSPGTAVVCGSDLLDEAVAAERFRMPTMIRLRSRRP